MKFVKWYTRYKSNPAPDNPVYLRLFQDDENDGRVVLRAVSHTGEPILGAGILAFNDPSAPDAIQLWGNPDIDNLKKDDDGYPVVVKD